MMEEAPRPTDGEIRIHSRLKKARRSFPVSKAPVGEGVM